MIFKKKGLSSIVGISLLIFVSVLSFIFLRSWFFEYESEFMVLISSKKIGDEFTITKVDGTQIFISNTYADNLKINSIKINNTECINRQWVINKSNINIDIGSCTAGLLNTKPYQIVITTNYGVINENEYVRNSNSGPFSINFMFGACDFASGYVRLYGLTDIDNAHAEIDGSSTYNLCIKHLDYNLGTSSSGNFVNLFYLTSQNNSAVWINKTSIYQAPSSWYNVSLSSTAGVWSYVVNSSDMGSLGYTCIGKISRDDIYGSHIGDCSSTLPDTLWIKLT